MSHAIRYMLIDHPVNFAVYTYFNETAVLYLVKTLEQGNQIRTNLTATSICKAAKRKSTCQERSFFPPCISN